MNLQRVPDIIRLYVVSPECTVIVAVIAVAIICPTLMIMIGNEVARQDSIFQYLALVPLGLLWVDFNLSKEMLRPSDNGTNRILYEWPDYWRIKYRSLGAVFFCLIASVLSITVWIFKTRISLLAIGAGLLGAILVALVTTLSQYLAYLRLREIINGGQ